MDHMEPESTPEATLHAYKTNCMKNNNRIRYSHFIFMSPKTIPGLNTLRSESMENKTAQGQA
jgi:hypothetical protein